MPARPRDEILSDLRALLAELDVCLHGEAKLEDDDISPKLRAALGVGEAAREGSARPSDKPAPSMAYSDRVQDATSGKPQDLRLSDLQREHPQRLKDYTPAADADWDESVFLGTGDSYDPLR